MQVKIKRIDPSLPLPVYHTPGSAGFDLYAAETMVIAPKAIVKIPANIIVETPPGYMLMIVARSSLAFKKGLMLSNGAGIIDSDYAGEEDKIGLSVYNFTDAEARLEKGDRIAQGIFVKVEQAEWVEADKMDGTSRGGFGSTGEAI